MITVGKRSLIAGTAICVVLMLAMAVSCNAALFGILKSKGGSKNAPAAKQSLMIFPFDKDAESATGVPDGFGQVISDDLRTTLSVSRGYSVIAFDERLTPIRRAKEDNVVKDQDIKGPFFTDKARADKLAELVGIDYYVIGSIESYTYNKDKKTVDLTLKADLINARTGKLSQEFLVGQSAAEAAQAMDEDALQLMAEAKAVEALTTKILMTSEADVQAQSKPKGKH